MKLTVVEAAHAGGKPGGHPYPGGRTVEIDHGDVVALGKLVAYGTFVIRYMLRLKDGREVFVKASEQPEDSERWLRGIAKAVRTDVVVSRDMGWTNVGV